MKRILFVCYGNICRSPMAEFIMKDIIEQAGKSDYYYVESAATSGENIGWGVYGPARQEIEDHGLDCSEKTARRICPKDYENFDLIVGMDSQNIANMRREFGGDPDGKIKKLLEYAGDTNDVADPWYTRDFAKTWDDISRGCGAMAKELEI